MKKLKVLTIIVLMLLISGCSNRDKNSKITFNTNAPKSTESEEIIKHNYTYTGENEFWKAEYKLNATEIFTSKTFVLKSGAKMGQLKMKTI